jgi:hypothetical protein
MKKRADTLKVLVAAMVLGVLANTSATPVYAKDTAEPARVTAIHDCNVEANKFNPITQLPNQFAVYATCMTKHGQIFG